MTDQPTELDLGGELPQVDVGVNDDAPPIDVDVDTLADQAAGIEVEP